MSIQIQLRVIEEVGKEGLIQFEPTNSPLNTNSNHDIIEINLKNHHGHLVYTI